MTVAFPYFKYLMFRENHRHMKVYCFRGTTHVRLILDTEREDGEDMIEGTCIGTETDNKTVVMVTQEDEKVDKTSMKTKCEQCTLIALRASFVLLALIAVMVAVALIIVSILTSIATKAYDTEMSHRVAAMVLLAMTAALAICMVIYGVTSVFKKQRKAVLATAIVLLLLAIIQALVGGIAITDNIQDEVHLLKSLANSFRQAKDDNNSRHHKIWAETQSEFQCCGLYSPEDYHNPREPYYFPPNLPISCCPSHNSSRSELLQERDRELCKATKTFYPNGCKDRVLLAYKNAAAVVLNITVVLVVIEIILLIAGALVTKFHMKPEESQDTKKDCS